MSARIGLEVHIPVRTASKLFCRCPTEAESADAARANTRICHVCTGQPGAKPLAPNAAAMSAALRLARAVGAAPQPRARFLRKHYFYPDLPSNYQRTSEPVARGGAIAGCPLWELHVEEDPGAYDPATGHVDYDRSGSPLIELVSAPDLASPAHARRFVQELRLACTYLGILRPDAALKADCNVSLDGGPRVEVKNVNSARNVERAIAHEIERQAREGATRETRHFDEASGRTHAMRAKETEADYRMLPDPDVAPVDIDALARGLLAEEGPFERRARLAALAEVAPEDASPLLEERALADLYERSPTRTRFHFLVRDLRAEFDHRATTLAASRLPFSDLEAIVEAREAERITPHVATRLLRRTFDEGRLGDALAEELAATSDPLDETVRAVLEANPRAIADYRAGKPTAINHLVGQAMRQLRGRGDANALRQAFERALQHP